MSEQRMVSTLRECKARLVPVGTPFTIPAHQFVTITQSLGGNYTVVYQGNMLRVDGTDADALGLEKFQLVFDDKMDDKICEEQVWQALETVYDPEIPVKPNVKAVEVELVFDPPWHRDMMSEEAQLETGMFF